MSEHECSKDRELDRLDRGVLANEKEIGILKVMAQKIFDKLDTLHEDITEVTTKLGGHDGRISKLESTVQRIFYLLIGGGIVWVINSVGFTEFLKGIFLN